MYIPDSEMAFVAIPYFVATARAPYLSYIWRVNDSAVPADANTPNEITIHSQSGGPARIQLSITDPHNAFLSTQDSWTANFLSGGSGSTGNSSDAFH